MKPDTLSFRLGESALRALCRYHQYEVHGFENIPATGPALLAFHHSLATYDSFLIAIPLYDRLGRILRGLADRQLFRTPIVGDWFTEMGFINGTREGTRAMLEAGEIIGLAPGGMREAMRSSQHKYEIDWEGRLGFVWVAMLAGAPIILGACPRADDLYDVYENPITPLIYDKLHLPLPIAKGWRGTPLPRPLKLWHLFSEPIFPDVPPDRVTERDVIAHHARLSARMKKLLTESLALEP